MKKSFFAEDIAFLLKQLGDLGWTILLVGGPVRDLSLGLPNTHDYDFELRGGDAEKLENDLKRVFKEVEICDFAVFKIHLEYGQLEFSLPRLEFYKGDGPFSHSNFSVSLHVDLPILESFKRRDFKFNAMAYSVNEGELADFFDPFSGLSDLQLKKMDFCDIENFFKDPVRLLRAVRFRRQFSLEFSRRLNEGLHQFNLTKLTPHHLFHSALKNNPVIFFRDLWKVIDEHNIKTADFMLHTRLILDLTWRNPLPYDREALVMHLAQRFTEEENVMRLVQAIGVSPGHFSSLVQFFDITNLLDLNELKTKQKTDFSLVAKEDISNFLSQWQKLQRICSGHLDRLKFFLPEQIHRVLDQLFSPYLPPEKEEIRKIVSQNALAPKEIWKVQLLYRMKKLAL